MFRPELLPSVLESAPDAMIVIDSAGTILFANRQVTALFGFDHSEVIGRPIELMLPERFHARHVGHRQAFLRHQRLRPMGTGQDLYALRRDGSEFPVEISLSPIHDGEQTFVAAAIRDVTDRKNAEAQIKAARAEADRANLAKSRFLATASHDLRQPLQALALLNGSLHRFVQDPDAQEALQEQDRAISTMAQLLNALLDISKLESGSVKAEITEFDVGSLFEELQRDFAPLAQGKGLRLEMQTSRLRARSDRTLLAQVLRNLISNAVKYTDQGWIRVGCEAGSDGLCIDVADSGIGISEEDRAYIFDEFYQVGASTHSSREGFGLGLSIVQRVARLLGLGLSVDSTPGNGSRFSLQVPAGGTPLSDEASRSRSRRTLSPRADQRCNILLVEDDPGVRKATRLFLHGEGYSVTTAASLSEALERAAELARIDLVITDYHLDGSERGTDVIAALREQRGQVNFILMTGDTSSAIRELPRDVQLRIISKPINADELLALVHSLAPRSAAENT